MDLLRTSVVDITTLVAACHALKYSPVEGDLGLERKLRGQLRREVKRGTLAYIDALARTKRGVVDDALLAACHGPQGSGAADGACHGARTPAHPSHAE